jgi:chemotaxis protein CheD
MLPTYSGEKTSHWEQTSVSTATRYGSFAMEYLINSILSKGGKRNNLEFKLFGGCSILDSRTTIGPHNIRFIKNYMREEGYSIAAESLGGSYPIIINYFPKTGVVKMKRLAEMVSEVARKEKSFLHALKETKIDGDIELFDDD